MHEFELIRPNDLGQCLDALAEHGEHASLLAGGTDLNILMETGLKTPRTVIDIGALVELRFLREEDSMQLIGAAATHADVKSGFAGLPCLSLASGSVGSPQIRNTATVGGNIANASPSGDAYPPLLALDAKVALASKRGEREVALAELASGPGETVIEPDELITHVSFDVLPEDAYTDFVKVGLRNALAISVASAAIVARGDGKVITDTRIACGAVAPRAVRMHDVEELVTGKPPDRALVEEAAKTATSICSPITDIRGTAEYRRHVTGVIVSRLLENAFERVAGYKREV
jgi:CO/xanthine dehydrogenase FAD-binding subunit